MRLAQVVSLTLVQVPKCGSYSTGEICAAEPTDDGIGARRAPESNGPYLVPLSVKVMPLTLTSASESSVPPTSAVKSPAAPLSPGFMKIAPPYHRKACLIVAPAGTVTIADEE